MGSNPQYYIPSHKVIGPLILEKKIFEGFLPHMGVAATLVMWPRPREQTFVPLSQWGSIWTLALIGPAVLEKKFFENGGRRTTDHGYTIRKIGSKYPSCVHALPIFLFFDKIQIVGINGITMWSNVNIETTFYPADEYMLWSFHCCSVYYFLFGTLLQFQFSSSLHSDARLFCIFEIVKYTNACLLFLSVSCVGCELWLRNCLYIRFSINCCKVGFYENLGTLV